MSKDKSSNALAYLLILRWAIALIFLVHGAQKIMDPVFGAHAEQFFSTLRDDISFGPYRKFFNTVVLPNANLFALMVKYGEVAVGTAYLFGFPLRLAVMAGIFLNINYIFISSVPSMLYFNALMIVCQFVINGVNKK